MVHDMSEEEKRELSEESDIVVEMVCAMFFAKAGDEQSDRIFDQLVKELDRRGELSGSFAKNLVRAYVLGETLMGNTK